MTTGQGSATARKTLHASPASLGVRRVQVGTRVYLNSGHDASNAWNLTSHPAMSSVFLEAPSTRFPTFAPDVAGTYVVTEGASTLTIYAGAAAATTDACTLCHSGTLAVDFFTPWQATRHAAVSVGCESCHGLIASSDHSTDTSLSNAYRFGSSGITFSSEACATCHGAAPAYDTYREWLTGDVNGWSHGSTANAIATSASTGLNPHCARCHTAQGYALWVPRLASGNPGNIDNNITEVTAANVEPITCAACHDPHDATNPAQLRVYGGTGLLPSGFSLVGIGKGALCATCHNTRNGVRTGATFAGTYLHEDTETYNSGNPISYSIPHQSAQADVYAGRNAYFMGTALPMLSKHALVQDGCVACHMTLNPDTRQVGSNTVANGHVFRISDANLAASCTPCHAGIYPAAVQAQVTAQLTSLGSQMGNAVKARIASPTYVPNGYVTVVAWDPATDLYSIAPGAYKNPNNLSPLQIPANAVTAAQPIEIHGQCAFMLTLAYPVTVQLVDTNGFPVGAPTSMTSFGVRLGDLKDGASTPAALFPLSSNLVRACWNYFVVGYDRSLGLHNPSFVNALLNATAAKDLSN